MGFHFNTNQLKKTFKNNFESVNIKTRSYIVGGDTYYTVSNNYYLYCNYIINIILASQLPST